MQCRARGEGEHAGGDDADPQPGERPGAEPADHVGQFSRRGPGLREHLLYAGCEPFAVGAGIEGGRLSQHSVAVVQRDGDGAGRGVESEQEHRSRLVVGEWGT
ncbi:MAG: hypothetical protein BWY91_01502 [bacterium ADurb.BinA028]|nr:MAG: hypothetical protein BWY91_01502 [bacterium ADurb.BinA028]